MQPPTGCEDFDDYVEDGRVAADRDAQREQARRFEEMSGCDFCNAQEREIARLTKELAEAQNTIGEMEEQCSTLESERNQINREREKAQAALETLRRYAEGTLDYWDRDEDHKVGKRLKAMAGLSRGYDSEIDKAHETEKAGGGG